VTFHASIRELLFRAACDLDQSTGLESQYLHDGREAERNPREQERHADEFERG
jgi:hypothetical protein